MAFPTTVIPSYSIVHEIEFKTLVSSFENGAEQRRNKWSQGKRQWTLVFDALTTAQIDTLYNFYTSQKGAYTSFTYTDWMSSTSTSFTVRFAEDRMSYEGFSKRLRRTGLKLIQVL